MAAVAAAGLLLAGAPFWAPAAVLVAAWNPVAGAVVAAAFWVLDAVRGRPRLVAAAPFPVARVAIPVARSAIPGVRAVGGRFRPAVEPAVEAAAFPVARSAIPGVRAVGGRFRPAVEPAVEAAYFGAVAAELRAGASLRIAVADAAARVPSLDLQPVVRRALAGVPFGAIMPHAAAALPVNGRVAPAALAIAASTGGHAAQLFEALAARAVHAAELHRERRALTAQARLSVFVVGVGPVLLALVLLAAGRAGPLLGRGGAGLAIAAIGLGLEVTGIVVAAAMLRRASSSAT